MFKLELWFAKRAYYSDDRFGIKEAAETFLQSQGEYQWYSDKEELNVAQLENMQEKLRKEREEHRNYKMVKHNDYLNLKNEKELREDTIKRQSKIIKGIEKVLDEKQKQKLEELRALSTTGLVLRNPYSKPLPADVTRFAENNKLYMEVT